MDTLPTAGVGNRYIAQLSLVNAMKLSELSSTQDVRSMKEWALKLRLLAAANSNIPIKSRAQHGAEVHPIGLPVVDDLEPSDVTSVVLLALSIAIFGVTIAAIFSPTCAGIFGDIVFSLQMRLTM